MTKNRTLFTAVIFVIAVMQIFLDVSSIYSQQEKSDDPRTWKYFKILARAQDDTVFVVLQDELNIEPKLESYVLIVNILDPSPINQYVVIGDETSPDAIRFLWSDLSPEVQKGLLNWTGSNKENLNKKKLDYGSVFTNVVKKIKVKDFIGPPSRERDILSTTAYINPYFQIFGGDPLGIPFKRSIGFSMNLGTPYSGPLETDLVGAGFHILGFSLNVNSRIKELVLKRVSMGDTGFVTSSTNLANYNNIFAPLLSISYSYVVPFGNFFEFGFFNTIDTGTVDPPEKVLNTKTNAEMPNNVIRGNYFHYEFRYPFVLLGSTRSKVYFGQLFGERHLGFVGREMRLAGSTFDLRIDATFKGRRNFQLLIEPIISDIGEGFSLTSFAIGPSFRLGTKPNNSFGILTVFLNMRLKIGDFFDERYGR